MQYISDVHLEYEHHINKPWPKIVKRARYLALAGDIGNPNHARYTNYLSFCCSKFDHVFVVAGNHELWSHEINTCKRRIRGICEEQGNCSFLDNDVVEVDGVRVFGATLWSDVTNKAAKGMNDFNTIYLDTAHLTPDDTRAMHHETVQKINTLLDESSKPLLVITHYAPLLAMNGDYGMSPNISAFCSDLWHLFRKPLVGWISGHTHSSVQTTENGIPCHSNCWGYDPKEYAGYRPDAVMDVSAWGPFLDFSRHRRHTQPTPFAGYSTSRRIRPDPLDTISTWLSTKPPSPPTEAGHATMTASQEEGSSGNICPS